MVLAARGAEVVMAVRDTTRGEAAAQVRLQLSAGTQHALCACRHASYCGLCACDPHTNAPMYVSTSDANAQLSVSSCPPCLLRLVAA